MSKSILKYMIESDPTQEEDDDNPSPPPPKPAPKKFDTGPADWLRGKLLGTAVGQGIKISKEIAGQTQANKLDAGE